MMETKVRTTADMPDALLLGSSERIVDHPEHSHSLSDVTGYVVRLTMVAGQQVAGFGRGTVGVDLHWVDDPHWYATALSLARDEREAGGYAVVDMVYGCGCRS